MAKPSKGKRSLNLGDNKVAVWENADGVFVGSTDRDCEFITALEDGAAKTAVQNALRKFGRKTG